MVGAVPDILARITAQTRGRLADVYAQLPELERRAEANRATRRDFRHALTANAPAIISEIKKASPSKGVLAEVFEPVKLAQAYESGGAAALSVLTDGPFFQGSLDDLRAARAAVKIPVLRKDFTLERAHIVEAAAHGADAVLLIAAILSAKELRDLREFAGQLGLAALVEVHDDVELDAALESGAEIIGVNNRDLRTFQVDLGTSLRLSERMPKTAALVSESGIESPEHVKTLRAAGYCAFLVGEHLVRSGDPTAALRKLRS